MTKLNLTSAAVERIKPPETGQVDYFDTSFPGFGFRVGRSGKKIYFLMTRVHGKQVRISLGQAKVGDGPGLTLAQARARAGAANDEAALGINPRQRRASEKAANRRRSENTFGAIADLYIAKYAKPRKRTWREDQRILDSYVKPVWGEIPITEITRADVAGLMDAVEDVAKKKTGKGFYMANRVLSCVRKLFNWAIDERALLENNPVGRKMARGVEGSRKRAFTDGEIKAIWNAAEAVGGFKGPMLKMLALTGQRRSVVSGMKHSEIDIEGKLWTVLGDETDRSKNKLDHIVPLSNQALAVYQSMPRILGKDHVFCSGARGDKAPIVGNKMAREFRKAAGFDDWCFQNLRSIVATKMKRPLSIPDSIIDRLQGRLDQSVLARNYDANDYLDDKRSALQAWANLLDEIVAGTERANVVQLREDV